MKINMFTWSEMDEASKQHLLARSETDINNILPSVSKIIEDVKTHGDNALKNLNHRFDKAPADMNITVSEQQIIEAEKKLSREVKEAIRYSVENVHRYHKHQCPNSIEWKEIQPGIMAGERTSPIDSVAFYVPRARGSFPSMLYMMAVPANIAGVKRIAMASPPDENGQLDAACLYTAKICKVHKVYAMGGAQAWAAFAYGTQSVQKVDKCIGPGSKYVAAAKRLLSDSLDCGLPAGPSESIILADNTPNPLDIARNLLVEAEHGSDSSALLITNSQELANKVKEVLAELIQNLPEPRRTFVCEVLSGYGGIIIVENIKQGAELANQFATEHLQIRTADPFDTLGNITHAGEILLGDYTPFSAANYSVGANAILPTGGKAKTWSGLSVHDFKKRSSVIYMTKDGLNTLKHHAAVLAEYEGFPAHKNALFH